MIQDIYKILLANGFSSKGQDLFNNKRLGIKRSFSDSLDNYIEIYTEVYGFSILIYGEIFMNGYHPYRCDITSTSDIETLRIKIEKQSIN